MLTETESDREFPNSLSQELGIELDAVAINGLKFNCNAIEFTILTNTLHEIRNDLLITFLVAPNLFTKKNTIFNYLLTSAFPQPNANARLTFKFKLSR